MHFFELNMKVWKFCFFFIFPLLSSTLGEDTVAEDLDVHQLERLVELLTSKECEDLLFALSHPEENIFQHLERLSPEKNQLDLKPRAKRDVASSSAEDSEAQCRTALTDWLLKYGKQTYYDRLSRALQHIGRADIAIEVGKNVNQDKALNLKRYVDGYHKYVSSLNVPSGAKHQSHKRQKKKKRGVGDLTWRDLDLMVQRAPVPPYSKGPLEVVLLPVLYGLLLGFGGTSLAGVFVFFVVVHITRRRQRSGHATPPDTKSSSCDVTMGEALLEDEGAASGRSSKKFRKLI